MGFVSGLLGTGGGVNGTGISGPNNTNILNPATTGQANEQYSIANTALGQQMNLVNALQGQNGLQNQSNVFNQLQGVANGTGPNPALAQLNQATGANTANQAALMAGQRGAGQNAGLIARQAAQQGATNQQNAAGQAATLQAQQQLNAMNQLGSIAGQQVGQLQQGVQGFNQAAQGEQGQVLNAIQGQNQANVGMQGNINSANAGLANTQMQGQHNLLGNAVSGIGSALGLAQGGVIPKMAYGGHSPVSVDYNNNDNVFPTNLDSTGATPYNPVSSTSPVAAPSTLAPAVSAPGAAKSSVGKFFQGMSNPIQNQPTGTAAAGQSIGKGIGAGLNALFGSSPKQQSQIPSENQYAAVYGAPGTRDANGLPTEDATYQMMSTPQTQMAKGGKVPALVSPGEIYLKPKQVKEVVKGADPMKIGEKIPGKAPVKGPVNSYSNDIVKKNLDAGGIIVPNKETKSKNPSEASQRFVHAIAAKHGMTVMPRKKK